MYNKKGIFENVEDNESKKAILKNIEKDYLSGATLKQISEDYSFTERQVRYIINHYIKINRNEYKKLIKKEKGIMKEEHEVVKVDDYNYMVDDKMARKSTIYDLVYNANLAKKERKKKSTNKKVENNN